MCDPALLPDPLDRGTMSRTDTPSPGTAGLGDDLGFSDVLADTPSLGQRVATFARDRIGQQVGNGECFTLADQALRSAGAGSAEDFGRLGGNVDYVWSSQIVNPADAQPGDIVQFRNFVVTRRVTTRTARDETVAERPHHTAIVAFNDRDGYLTVLEQNVAIGGSSGQRVRTVRQNRIPIRMGTTTVGNTTTVVSGTIVVYRPVLRPASSRGTSGGTGRPTSRRRRRRRR